MKPSERIVQIMKDSAKGDPALKDVSWEEKDDLALLNLYANASAYTLTAILQYLDEQAESNH